MSQHHSSFHRPTVSLTARQLMGRMLLVHQWLWENWLCENCLGRATSKSLSNFGSSVSGKFAGCDSEVCFSRRGNDAPISLSVASPFSDNNCFHSKSNVYSTSNAGLNVAGLNVAGLKVAALNSVALRLLVVSRLLVVLVLIILLVILLPSGTGG